VLVGIHLREPLIFRGPYSNWALTKSELDQNDEAEAHYREGEVIFREIFGPEHAAVAIAHTRLGQATHQRGDLSGAERILREAVAIHRPLLPSARARFAETLYELGEVLIKQDKPGAAEAHLTEALAIFVETKGTDSSWTHETRALLAELSP
jgi:tetratricopeptide (TPR) repeat protein